MDVEHWHQGRFCGNTGFEDTIYTPEGVLESYKRTGDQQWYDVMWGSSHYNIKSVKYADNQTKILVKLEKA